jgi:sugar O-acyltransferase (sialic acid O-acetyltransferase NeuD family)
MEKVARKDKIVIIGDGEFAEIAYEYFTYDSPYKVVAFAVERPYMQKKELFSVPIVSFEEVEKSFDPSECNAFIAVTFTQLNRLRTRLYKETKRKGYDLASYVSSKAFVWRNAEVGDNCFVFENNVLQYMTKLGNNVIMWSGNHLGHRSIIHDNTFVSSHSVISGFCDIGESCFLGVNSCIKENTKIANDCVIGAGAVVVRDTEPGKVYVGNPARPSGKTSFEAFKVSYIP